MIETVTLTGLGEDDVAVVANVSDVPADWKHDAFCYDNGWSANSNFVEPEPAEAESETAE